MNHLPGVLLVDEVRCMRTPRSSSNLLVSDLPTLMTAPVIGWLFSPYGKLTVNMLYTTRQGLVALIQFENESSAIIAHKMLNNMKIQMEVPEQQQPESKVNQQVQRSNASGSASSTSTTTASSSSSASTA